MSLTKASIGGFSKPFSQTHACLEVVLLLGIYSVFELAHE